MLENQPAYDTIFRARREALNTGQRSLMSGRLPVMEVPCLCSGRSGLECCNPGEFDTPAQKQNRNVREQPSSVRMCAVFFL